MSKLAPRIYSPVGLGQGVELALSSTGARHVQVLRLQPGDDLILFDGHGGEYTATITHMGRSDVRVRVLTHHATEREAARVVHLVLGVPANERMDWLVEKATELGVNSITPLMTERTVLRLHAERAQKKQAHWQAIAVAACEQCGRNRVPVIEPVQSLTDWLTRWRGDGRGLLLSLQASRPAADGLALEPRAMYLLSGPEGGLSPAEEASAMERGFVPTSLGPRVLRAETAALAALAALSADLPSVRV